MKKKPEKIVQADTPEGQRAGEAIVEAVENQLKEDNPPEANRTLKRLMAIGETRKNAIRYIGTALSVEVVEIFKNKTPFNEQRYINNLKALPELPYDDE